jgi:hypothetical protein
VVEHADDAADASLADPKMMKEMQARGIAVEGLFFANQGAHSCAKKASSGRRRSMWINYVPPASFRPV